MRRSYRREKYLGIIDRVRAAMPDAAITTDIIVGFPGETEDDFVQTLEVVAAARFSGAFTFQYSQRPGTPAATLPDQVPADVVKHRYERLVTLVNDIAWDENKRLVGSTVELMVAEGEGRKDAATHRLSGRGPDNRLVHFDPRDSASAPSSTNGVRPGDMVTVEITRAAPHHLVADGGVLAVRRTRSGDAWEARTAAPSGAGRRAGYAHGGCAGVAVVGCRGSSLALLAPSTGDHSRWLRCEGRQARASKPRRRGYSLRGSSDGYPALGSMPSGLDSSLPGRCSGGTSSASAPAERGVSYPVGGVLARTGVARAFAADAHAALGAVATGGSRRGLAHVLGVCFAHEGAVPADGPSVVGGEPESGEGRDARGQTAQHLQLVGDDGVGEGGEREPLEGRGLGRLRGSAVCRSTSGR